MQNKIILIILLSLALCGCKQNTELRITDFTAQNELSKGNEGTKSIYYLVEGYSGSESDYDVIQKHMCSINRDSLSQLYKKQFWLSYYRKSEKTNNEHIASNPKDFFRHSSFYDIIASYTVLSESSLVMYHKYYLDEYPRTTITITEDKLCP